MEPEILRIISRFCDKFKFGIGDLTKCYKTKISQINEYTIYELYDLYGKHTSDGFYTTNTPEKVDDMMYCGSYIFVEKENIVQAIIILSTPIEFIIELSFKNDENLRKTLIDIRHQLVRIQDIDNKKIFSDLSTAFDVPKKTQIIYFDKNEILN